MGDVSVVHSNAGGALREIARFGKLTRPETHHEMLEEAGKTVAFQVVPMRFREGGPDSQGNPWVNNERGGSPLIDKGIMQTQTNYDVRGNESLAIGNTARQARLDNRGGPLAGKKPNAKAEVKAFEHYHDTFNKGARVGSWGWMYVKKREFLYFGEFALNKILDLWRRRYAE
jgi:hypothetical protein